MFSNKNIKIADIQLYNNEIYTLIENIGLVMQNQSGTILNTWAFTEQFSRFNIFIDQFGVKTVLVGTDYQLVKYKLQGNNLFTIAEQYGIEKFQNVVKVYHNNKFSLVQGTINTDKNVIWVFDDYNRLSSNLFIAISNSKLEESFIIYNPITNQILSLFKLKAIKYKIQDPVLTIDSYECKPENGSIVIYGTTSQEQTCLCDLKIQQISKNDYGIFQLENNYSIIQVTDQSLNEFSLQGIVKGANIQYSDNSQELKYFLFKNQTTVFNSIQPNDKILLHKIYVLETDPIAILQIIQVDDLSKSLYIYKCDTGESLSNFTCNLQFEYIVRQPIDILISRSYINPIFIAFTTGDNNITIIYSHFIGNMSVLTNQFNYFDQIKGIVYISQQFLYLIGDNKIDLYQLLDKQFNLLNTITAEYLSNLTNFTVTTLFNIHNKLEDNYLYISTDVGIITLDTGLYRYNQINLISFYQFTYQQLQPYTVILSNHWVIVKLIDQLYVINYLDHQKPYYQKILQTYFYKLIDPLIYAVGDNSSLLYIKAVNNNNYFFLVFALDEFQLSTFFTTISCDDSNVPAAISTREQDYIFYFNKSVFFNFLQAKRIYKDIKYIFQSTVDNTINIKFQGMLDSKINYELVVQVKNTDQQLNLSIINNSEKVNEPIYYNDSSTDIINLIGFNQLVIGSVGNWKIKCYKCPEDLQLINYIDFYRNVQNIGSANQIKRSIDYVFVQQKSNLIAIDSGSDITFIISLPITDANFDCQTLAPSLYKNKTLFVVSVCNSYSLTQFFVTSFVSSQPFAMGPFITQIFLHSISHIRVLNELVFLLDDFTDTIYVFDLELAISSTKNELKLQVYLNAEDITKDNQYFINFDVAFIDENQPSYIIFLLTNKQQLILFLLTKSGDGSNTYGTQFDPPYNIKNIVNQQDQPTNVIPTNIIIARQDLSQLKKEYRVIIVNENYHHFELNITISNDAIDNFSEINFVKAYLSYGYYVVSGKSRASEMDDGFFGAIYLNPLHPSQKVLVVYDSKDYAGDSDLSSKYRKLWGGYQINSDSKILFDFLHKSKNENSKRSEIQNGIILIVGGNITSLSLSRDLAIKVNNKQFKDRSIQFNATNDFNKTVTFEKDIFNQTGKVNNMILWIILCLLMVFVIAVSIIVVKRRLKKNNEVHTISDLTSQTERQDLKSFDLSPSYSVTPQRENLIQNF